MIAPLTFVRVHVDPKKNPEMVLFVSDFDAIVKGSYAYLHHGGGKNAEREYSVWALENGRIVNNISWYNEDQLTPTPVQDSGLAAKLVQAYIGGTNDRPY